MPMVLGMGMELPEKQDEKKPYILLKYAEQKYRFPWVTHRQAMPAV